jgi:S-formylglutathione hydrolase FrmB
MMEALLFFLLVLSSSTFACSIEDESFRSPTLSQDTNSNFIERYLVIKSKKFDASEKYAAVYFLHGRGGNRYFIRDLGICETIDRLSDENKANFLIIAPDGNNSYWLDGAYTHQRWAKMVSSDLIEDAERKLPLKKGKAFRVLSGISMGGHGAIQIGLNYPHVFGAIGAHSPVFRTQEEASRDFYYEFGTGEDYQQRDPFSLMKIKGKRLSAPLYIDMGGQDEWIKNTSAFSQYLSEINFQGVSFVGSDSQGGHRNGYWQHHFLEYLRWYSTQLANK